MGFVSLFASDVFHLLCLLGCLLDLFAAVLDPLLYSCFNTTTQGQIITFYAAQLWI
uniref:Uncharacterized protein n=1 Tax=Manihot esculenta TaxID=3983 RepID=A0A2C9WR46_MANES